MFASNKSSLIITAASVQAGFGLEVKPSAIIRMKAGKAIGKLSKMSTRVEDNPTAKMAPDQQRRLAWEASTIGRWDTAQHVSGGGFSLKDFERDAVATIAVFAGLFLALL